jgi:2,3-bisphosphoglycerate-dependent phosphoglycerate mutase
MTMNREEHRATEAQLVLLRHAQSAWNLENRFTGWADVPLTSAGRAEAHRAGTQLRDSGLHFDRAFVSLLERATETLEIVRKELAQPHLVVERTWRLNERHYGALEGLDKAAVAARESAEQLHRYRRGYRDRPPALDNDDPRHPRHQALYRDVDPTLLPATESLADARARLLPYWEECVAPAIARGERVLIVSHNNTLRALIMHLEGMTEAEVERFEIPTGRPIVIDINEHGLATRRTWLEEYPAVCPHLAAYAR